MFDTFAQFLREESISNWDMTRQSNSMIDDAAKLCDEIEAIDNSYTALIVGGAVRDLLMGNSQVHDVDIATNAPLDVLEAMFSTHDIGKSKDFGIVTIKYGQHNFEVANFRKEEGYSDNRRPDKVTNVDTFEHDAARRDFTFNAMGLTSDGQIVDYYGGADDIRKGVIRAVGNAQQRFEEDALRLLRAIRFASKFGFDIEHDTEQAIKKLAFTVNNLSPERIHQELIKTAELGGPALAKYVRKLDRVGMLDKILPEIKALHGMKHNLVHHPEADGDVLGHVLAAVEQSPSKDPIENLAVLFHDLGKATTLGKHKDTGQPTYYGHEAAGAPIFDKIADRLKFTNDEREAIKLAITDHMHGHNIEKLSTKKLVAMRQHKHWPVLKNTIYSDEASREHLFDKQAFERKMKYVEDLFQKFGDTAAFEAKMGALVNGQMIMALVPGVKGKDIGRIKDAVRDWIIENEFNVTVDQVKGKIEQVA